MIPRWLALVLVGAVLIAAGAFLAPLAPSGVDAFAQVVLYIGGAAAVVWGLIVLIMASTRSGPNGPA